jgi:hypothetical protein
MKWRVRSAQTIGEAVFPLEDFFVVFSSRTDREGRPRQ